MTINLTSNRNAPAASFDLCRVSKAKGEVDVCSNTIRNYHRLGYLRLYYTGRAAWFSKSELMEVIRRGIPRQSASEKGRAVR